MKEPAELVTSARRRAEIGSSTWTYSTGEEIAALALSWGTRTEEVHGRQAIEEGIATLQEIKEIAEGWRTWSENPDAWFCMVHGELLYRKVL